jgi:hypothetical protein
MVKELYNIVLNFELREKVFRRLSLFCSRHDTVLVSCGENRSFLETGRRVESRGPRAFSHHTMDRCHAGRTERFVKP